MVTYNNNSSNNNNHHRRVRKYILQYIVFSLSLSLLDLTSFRVRELLIYTHKVSLIFSLWTHYLNSSHRCLLVIIRSAKSQIIASTIYGWLVYISLNKSDVCESERIYIYLRSINVYVFIHAQVYIFITFYSLFYSNKARIYQTHYMSDDLRAFLSSGIS